MNAYCCAEFGKVGKKQKVFKIHENLFQRFKSRPPRLPKTVPSAVKPTHTPLSAQPHHANTATTHHASTPTPAIPTHYYITDIHHTSKPSNHATLTHYTLTTQSPQGSQPNTNNHATFHLCPKRSNHAPLTSSTHHD